MQVRIWSGVVISALVSRQDSANGVKRACECWQTALMCSKVRRLFWEKFNYY